MKEKYTLEGYQKNYYKSQKLLKRKALKRREKLIYKGYQTNIELKDSELNLFDENALQRYLNLKFPFIKVVCTKGYNYFKINVILKEQYMENDMKDNYEKKLERERLYNKTLETKVKSLENSLDENKNKYKQIVDSYDVSMKKLGLLLEFLTDNLKLTTQEIVKLDKEEKIIDILLEIKGKMNKKIYSSKGGVEYNKICEIIKDLKEYYPNCIKKLEKVVD